MIIDQSVSLTFQKSTEERFDAYYGCASNLVSASIWNASFRPMFGLGVGLLILICDMGELTLTRSLCRKLRIRFFLNRTSLSADPKFSAQRGCEGVNRSACEG